MTEKELEYLLLENLKYNKENHHYLIKIDRRQRWTRNWQAFYWGVIIVAAIGGYFYAFPYLQTLRDEFRNVNSRIGSVVDYVTPDVNSQ